MPFSGDTKKRIVGPAFTLRFVPVREDLATPASWAAPISTRAAIEAMPEGVHRGRRRDGRHHGGHLRRHPLHAHGAARREGARHRRRGARQGGRGADRPADLVPGTAAPASVNGLTFVGWQEPIACGGVAVFPDDVIVVDDDGAVLIPKDLVELRRRGGRGARALRELGRLRGGARRRAAGPLSTERRGEGALRGVEEEGAEARRPANAVMTGSPRHPRCHVAMKSWIQARRCAAPRNDQNRQAS